MDIVGYADRYSVRAGNIVRFMVSCKLPGYTMWPMDETAVGASPTTITTTTCLA